MTDELTTREHKRAMAYRLTRAQFDALDAPAVGELGQAFYRGDRVECRADRERVWRAIQHAKTFSNDRAAQQWRQERGWKAVATDD